MMTKLSRMDSSSRVLKYSVKTATRRWRKRRMEEALGLRLERART